jgi:hypothetical protein
MKRHRVPRRLHRPLPARPDLCRPLPARPDRRRLRDHLLLGRLRLARRPRVPLLLGRTCPGACRRARPR